MVLNLEWSVSCNGEYLTIAVGLEEYPRYKEYLNSQKSNVYGEGLDEMVNQTFSLLDE